MKKILSLITLFSIGLTIMVQAQDEKKEALEHLNVKTFKEKVYDYDTNPDKWVFEGKRPVLIDFYADWCKPCKMIAPTIAELANDYDGKIDIYKVNTQYQRELASLFKVKSIPTIVLIPMEGKPQFIMGARPKTDFEKAIDSFLLGKKVDQ